MRTKTTMTGIEGNHEGGEVEKVEEVEIEVEVGVDCNAVQLKRVLPLSIDVNAAVPSFCRLVFIFPVLPSSSSLVGMRTMFLEIFMSDERWMLLLLL